jgi:hypothetical protein
MLRLFGRRKKATFEPEIHSRGSPLASMTDAITGSLKDLPRGQETKELGFLEGLISYFNDSYAGYPDDSRQRLIKVFKMLAEADEDAGGAIRDIRLLGNSKYEWQVEGGTRATAQALEELKTWSGVIYPGGIDSLTDNQLLEIYAGGASSLEWVPAENRKGIVRVEPVPCEEVLIKKQKDGTYTYSQSSQVGVDLHPMTFVYYPFMTSGRSRYGVPTILSALKSLWRKSKLIQGEDRIIKALSTLAFVVAQIEKPKPESLGVFDGPNTKGYLDALASYTKKVADLLAASADSGLMVTPQGIEIKTTNTTTNTSGAEKILEHNDRMLWSGLGTLPFMRGKMDSTTQALSEVVYPIVLSLAQNMTEIVDANISHGANLHLRLKGIPASVKIVRKQPHNPFRKTQAEAEKIEAETDKLLTELYGEEYRIQSAQRRGLDPAKLERREVSQNEKPSTENIPQ